MGIDVYMRWPDQTESERQAQYTGFSLVHGHVGYLREAYHGEPYATKVLVPEAFASDGEPVEISAATLRERLPLTLVTCDLRHRTVYTLDSADEIATFQDSYTRFVELAESQEARLGHPVTIQVSG